MVSVNGAFGKWLARNVVWLLIVAFAAGGVVTMVTQISGAVEANTAAIKVNAEAGRGMDSRLRSIEWRLNLLLCVQGEEQYCEIGRR